MSHYLQVPTEVLPYAGKLSATQLLIWADAWMFKKNTGKAYRTNAQLSEMLNVTERSVSRAVQELIKIGAITVQSNGRNRVMDAIEPNEWKVDTYVHRRTRPPTQTSTDVDVHADPTHTSMQGRHIRPCSMDADVHLIDKRIDKGIDKGIDKETAAPEIVMPWNSEAFAEAWALWKDERKAKRLRKYTPRGEQAQLHKLQTECGTEEAAIAAIHHSIAQGYQGIFPDRNNKQQIRKVEGGHMVGTAFMPDLNQFLHEDYS